MSNSATCPHCGRTGRVPDDVVGKTVRCPACKGQFAVGGSDVSDYVRDDLMSGERVIYVARLHWGMFFEPAVCLTVAFLVIAFGLVVGGHSGTSVAGGGGAMLLVSSLFFLARMAKFVSSEFVVTDQRLLIKEGLISRRSLELLLSKVESVSMRQPVFGRLFGYGTVCIGGTGGTKEEFSAIADPLELCRRVREQIRR